MTGPVRTRAGVVLIGAAASWAAFSCGSSSPQCSDLDCTSSPDQIASLCTNGTGIYGRSFSQTRWHGVPEEPPHCDYPTNIELTSPDGGVTQIQGRDPYFVALPPGDYRLCCPGAVDCVAVRVPIGDPIEVDEANVTDVGGTGCEIEPECTPPGSCILGFGPDAGF